MGLEPCGFTERTKGSRCPCCGVTLRRDLPTIPSCDCASSAPYLTQLTPTRYLWQCRNCNWTLETDSDEEVQHVCGQAKAPRLGDRIELALTEIGITKERWLDFKARFHLPRTCNCDARKEWLNQLGDKLGAAAKAAVETLK